LEVVSSVISRGWVALRVIPDFTRRPKGRGTDHVHARNPAEVIPETQKGEFVSFPDSPFELFQPYPPAGDQPDRD
jgi:hypothetical protein